MSLNLRFDFLVKATRQSVDILTRVLEGTGFDGISNFGSFRGCEGVCLNTQIVGGMKPIWQKARLYVSRDRPNT